MTSRSRAYASSTGRAGSLAILARVRAGSVRRDDAALAEEDLLGAQAALAVLEWMSGSSSSHARTAAGPVAGPVGADDSPSSAGTIELGIVPFAPASRSGIRVTDSSPSKGPRRSGAKGADQRVQLVGGLRDLDFYVLHPWAPAQPGLSAGSVGSGVGDRGASCTMMGMSISSATCRK